MLALRPAAPRQGRLSVLAILIVVAGLLAAIGALLPKLDSLLDDKK